MIQMKMKSAMHHGIYIVEISALFFYSALCALCVFSCALYSKPELYTQILNSKYKIVMAQIVQCIGQSEPIRTRHKMHTACPWRPLT